MGARTAAFLLLLSSTTSANADEQCSANQHCANAGLEGACCPDLSGQNQACCEATVAPSVFLSAIESASCSNFATCTANGITGQCCPTLNNDNLACCGFPTPVPTPAPTPAPVVKAKPTATAPVAAAAETSPSDGSEAAPTPAPPPVVPTPVPTQNPTPSPTPACPAGYQYSHEGFWNGVEGAQPPFGIVSDDATIESCAASCGAVTGDDGSICVGFSVSPEAGKLDCEVYSAVGLEENAPGSTACKTKICTCVNGTAAEGETCPHDGAEACVACLPGNTLVSGACINTDSLSQPKAAPAGSCQMLSCPNGEDNVGGFCELAVCSTTDLAKCCEENTRTIFDLWAFWVLLLGLGGAALCGIVVILYGRYQTKKEKKKPTKRGLKKEPEPAYVPLMPVSVAPPTFLSEPVAHTGHVTYVGVDNHHGYIEPPTPEAAAAAARHGYDVAGGAGFAPMTLTQQQAPGFAPMTLTQQQAPMYSAGSMYQGGTYRQ